MSISEVVSESISKAGFRKKDKFFPPISQASAVETCPVSLGDVRDFVSGADCIRNPRLRKADPSCPSPRRQNDIPERIVNLSKGL